MAERRSLWDRLLGRGKARRRVDLPDYVSGMAQAAMWSDEFMAPSYWQAQAERYTRSDLVYLCVNKIAEAGAMAKAEVWVNGEPDPDHPFLTLLQHPNPFLSRFELWEATHVSLELAGNAFWYKQLVGNSLAGLWPLRPDRMSVVPDPHEYVKAYVYEVNGRKWELPREHVVHFRRYHPLKDYEGLSPLEAAQYAVVSDLSAQKFNWAFFKNGAKLSVVLESDEEQVTPEELRLMERYFIERFTGDPEKGHRPAFLWAGFKAKDLGISQKDAEFIEGQKLNRMRIFGLYGVHPGLVLSEDVNLANARVAEHVFAKWTLAPKLTRIAEKVTADILAPHYGEGHELRFVDVVPRDQEFELRQWVSLLDRGALTVNEVRQQMGLDPVPWGDTPFITRGGLPAPPAMEEVLEREALEPYRRFWPGGNGHEREEEELEAMRDWAQKARQEPLTDVGEPAPAPTEEDVRVEGPEVDRALSHWRKHAPEEFGDLLEAQVVDLPDPEERGG